MQDVLSFLSDHVKQNRGLGPTTAQIQSQFRWRSRTSVVQVMRQLTREGLIEKIPGPKLRYKRIINDPNLTQGFAKIRLLTVGRGQSFENAAELAETFWIDRRMFGVTRRRTPFLIQFGYRIRSPLAMRANHALLVLPYEELRSTRSSWVLATVGGRIGVHCDLEPDRRAAPLATSRPKRKAARSSPNAIHGRVLAVLFVAPHREFASKETIP
jgi:hypothetical protein